MATPDFTVSLLVDESPETVFHAVNNVPAWWPERFKGASLNEGDEFEVFFGDVHYSKQQITEMIPGKRVVWLVTDSDLSFLDNKQEWTGTRVIFDISRKGDKTELRLTHEGLMPGIECFGACAPAWTKYMYYSLQPLIAKGKGQPGFPPAGPLE